jgi:hypothetical protein
MTCPTFTIFFSQRDAAAVHYLKAFRIVQSDSQERHSDLSVARGARFDLAQFLGSKIHYTGTSSAALSSFNNG